ncbi:MAG: hypothetical protein HQ555_06880 [Candidatus Aminicenantes bacterium]|nr:hypothetical protein [Candidatus Aminicenantes bacterium]
MLKKFISVSFFLFTILLMTASNSYSQEEAFDIEELKKSAPKVFIDCDSCDIDYIRTEITFVNYVWDRQEADIHMLITLQGTGSGGREYTIAFIGQKDYSDLQNTLKYFSSPTETDDEVRKGLVQTLKLGLAPYVARTPMAQAISLLLKQEVKPTAVEDKWNFWVFNVSLYSDLSGEEQQKSTELSGNFSANRVTPASKLRMGLDIDYEKDRYDVDGETITSISESRDFDGMYVKSISEHWSVGGWVSLSSSTYRNIDFSYTIHPAIEYNFFPYSLSTRRQLRVLYKIGHGFYRYRDETIYDKTSENLWNESLSITLELNEPWGTAELSLEGSHYFHDLNKNRLVVSGELSLRIYKGLSLYIEGRYSKIRDQLSLARGEATLEEILLHQRELASGYQKSFEIGLSYRFGSIFSNVVNPRFGDGNDY